MLVLVAYESIYGNTEAVAEAIAEGASSGRRCPEVLCLPAVHVTAELVGCAAMLVVGAPTHYHGMPSRRSLIAGRQLQRRATLAGSVVLVSPDQDEDVDLRAWLRRLPDARPGAIGAAFDTRLTSRWAGGAASGIARRLRKHHFELMLRPEGFTIESALGPPRAGELARATEWGDSLRRLLRT
jgi:flavorubredoxin